MGAFGSHEESLRYEEVEELAAVSGFTRHQILQLFDRFVSLDTSSKGYLTRSDLLRLPELSMNPLRNRILAHFQLDTLNAHNTMNFKDFVTCIAPFNYVNEAVTKETKIRLAFEIFDQNRNGKISKQELMEVLRMMTGTQNDVSQANIKNKSNESYIDEEALEEMVDKVIAESDMDGDGMLSFDEFASTLTNINVEKDFTIGPWKEE